MFVRAVLTLFLLVCVSELTCGWSTEGSGETDTSPYYSPETSPATATVSQSQTTANDLVTLTVTDSTLPTTSVPTTTTAAPITTIPMSTSITTVSPSTATVPATTANLTITTFPTTTAAPATTTVLPTMTFISTLTTVSTETTTRRPNPCLSGPCIYGVCSTVDVAQTQDFRCDCYIGYYGNTCSIVNPCLTNPLLCNNRGTCTAKSTPNYFTCTCFSGYTGANCDQVQPLYPYGKTANDLAFYGTDDGATPRIGFTQGFLFFGRFPTSAYINMNGFMSFSINYMSYTPLSFPHYDGLNADLLSPFWADADSSGVYSDCCGNNVVYYHIYQTDPTRTTPLSSSEQRVFDMARQDGSTFFQSPFNPSWIMVVTWSNVIPWPYYYNLYSYERNTFQLVLAMDAVLMKSIASYRYANLGWNPRRPAVMGYQAMLSNAFYNYPGNVYQLASVPGIGSTDIGVTIFDVTGFVTPTPHTLCLQWIGQQTMTSSGQQLIPSVSQLRPCPCSAFQALFTPGYTWLWNTNCFISTDYYAPSYPNHNAMKCCYELNAFQWSFYWYQWQWMWTYTWLGNLITTPGYNSGNSYMNNPLYFSGDEDTAKLNCCLYSNNCQAYNQVRPLDTCTRYMPPFFAFGFGDPHIKTLDGLEYDYNGIGEYWLLMSSILSIQVRSQVAWDTNGNPVNASVFAACSIQVPEGPGQNISDRVYVAMDASRTALNLLIIPASRPNSDAQDMTSWLRNTTLSAPQFDTLTNNSGLILTRLKNGLVLRLSTGVMVIVRLLVENLEVIITADKSQLGSTGGLLGLANGDSTDDFTLRDGSFLPSDSSAEVIYNLFGENWRISQQESIMWYPPGVESSSFQDTTFVPMLTPTFSSLAQQQQAEALCGGSASCLLDYAATGNANLAAATAEFFTASNAAAQILGSPLPTINGTTTIRATVGVQYTAVYTSQDSSGNNIILNMTGLPLGATFDSNTGIFTWVPLDRTPVPNLRVTGVDASGIPAMSLDIVVLLCDCGDNHGSCQFDSTILTYNDSFRFQHVACSCFSGYSGDYCSDTVDMCKPAPCGSNASCSSEPPGQVNVYNLSYNCFNCPTGFNLTGGKCVDYAVMQLNNQNRQSICFSTPCLNGGTCQGSATTFTCTCLPGYTGDVCQKLVDTCSSNPCYNQGTCISAFNSYSCSCAPGFTGDYCQIVTNTCGVNPCLNGAGCAIFNNMSLCLCVPGYVGSLCQTVYDNCQSSPCRHGGSCYNAVNKYTCTCTPEYSGNMCQTRVSYAIQTMLQFKVGTFTWTDDLEDSNKVAFTSYSSQTCLQMNQSFSDGVAGRSYLSCNVHKFRQGSVYAVVYLWFAVPASDYLTDLAFADLVYTALKQSLTQSNRLQIDIRTLKFSVLSYGDNDPCLSSNCQQVCETESATTFNCSCFTGHHLVDDHKCIGIAPVSVIDSLTLVIALPLGVVGGVFLTLLLAACCYYNSRSRWDDSDNSDISHDRRRNSSFSNRRLHRSDMGWFGFAPEGGIDWSRSSLRGDYSQPHHMYRPATRHSVIDWRLPSRMQGIPAPDTSHVNFRQARAYQPYQLIGQYGLYQPYRSAVDYHRPTANAAPSRPARLVSRPAPAVHRTLPSAPARVTTRPQRQHTQLPRTPADTAVTPSFGMLLGARPRLGAAAPGVSTHPVTSAPVIARPHLLRNRHGGQWSGVAR